MLRSLIALGFLASALTAQDPPAGYEYAPVALPPEMKAALAKRVALEKGDGTAEELLTKIAADNKLKIEFSPALRKQSAAALEGRGLLVSQKGVRLDIVFHQFLSSAGVPPVCVVKENVLVFTTPDDQAAVVKKKANQAGAVVVSVVRQPPDSGHAFIVSALRKKMAEKSDFEAMNNVPLSDVLGVLTKKTGMPFPIHAKSFEAAGRPNVGDQRVTVRGGKGVTHDAVLRETLKAVDGELHIDGYGTHRVVHKDEFRRPAPKK